MKSNLCFYGGNRSPSIFDETNVEPALGIIVGRMNKQFLACSGQKDSDAFLEVLGDNKRLFRTATENAAVLGMDKKL